MRHLNVLTATAFATGVAAAASTAGKKAGAPKAEDRVVPLFTDIATDIAIPAKSQRGSKSELAERLAKIEVVGHSIGLTNKSKKQISSTLSKVNNAASNLRNVTDANGNTVMKNGEAIKDANGAVIGYSQIAVTERVKEFEAFDVNPKEDKQGASVRIFRIK